MKRIGWLLCCLLVLCIALPVMGEATASEAATQEEWDLSCVKKTTDEAVLYEYSGDKPGAELGKLPKGTYVKVSGAKSDHWMELVYFGYGKEQTGWAQVTLEDCVSKIKKADGRLYDVHELDPEYDKKIAEGTLVFDVKLYSDYAAYQSFALGLGPEPLRKDGRVTATGTGLSEGDATDEEDEFAVDDEESADPKKDKAADKEKDADKDDAKAALTPTTEVAETGDEEVVELGTYQSTIKVNKKKQVVLTSSLTFSEEVPKDQQLAVVYAPRTGNATLRKKPADNGGTVKKLEGGTVVRVLEVGTEYTKVQDGKKEGYVTNTSLKFYAPATTIEGMALLSKNGLTNGRASINIRSEADKDSAKIDSWKTGTEMIVFSHSDGWYEVEANGKRGYVMESFVTLGE